MMVTRHITTYVVFPPPLKRGLVGDTGPIHAKTLPQLHLLSAIHHIQGAYYAKPRLNIVKIRSTVTTA
jgi:hypothetical protein